MEDEFLNFYHISRDASAEKADKFISEGIVPSRGNGYGGQSNGFYCWTNKEAADKFYCSLLVADNAQWAMENFGIDIRLKDGEALKLEVPVKKDSIKYPEWQLDNEQHPNIKRGRTRPIFLDFWKAQKNEFNTDVNFEIKNSQGEYYIVNKLGWDNATQCPTIEYLLPSGQSVVEKVDNTNANNSNRTQAINNYLCSNSATYKNNYDKLIQAVATNSDILKINGELLHTSNIALKYCSQKPLKNLSVSKLKGCIIHDSETEKKTKQQNGNEVCYGDYRISINEQKLTKTDNYISKKIKDLRGKISKPFTSETKSHASKIYPEAIISYQNKKYQKISSR